MCNGNDWREQGQEKYLSGLVFILKPYHPARKELDHDHCEFCGQKFSIQVKEALHRGYVSQDGYRWICEQCMTDFKVKYNLIIDNEL